MTGPEDAKTEIDPHEHNSPNQDTRLKRLGRRLGHYLHSVMFTALGAGLLTYVFFNPLLAAFGWNTSNETSQLEIKPSDIVFAFVSLLILAYLVLQITKIPSETSERASAWLRFLWSSFLCIGVLLFLIHIQDKDHFHDYLINHINP